jgi:hypothetical protein
MIKSRAFPTRIRRALIALIAVGAAIVGANQMTLAARFDTITASESVRAAVWRLQLATFQLTQAPPVILPATAPLPAPLDDGSTPAPLGISQHPDLLSGYMTRPPWKVAGVDYRVGITPGTILKPITSIRTPGVEIDAANRLIRITGQNITIDGYDFSGWGLYIQGKNITIQNCYSNDVRGFGIVGRIDGMYNGIDYTSHNLTIRNCEIDGTGRKFKSQWSFINIKGTGTTTIEYNWFHNAPTHIFEFHGSSTLIYRYNLEEEIGIDPTGDGPTNHVNFIQMLGAGSANSQIVFNTMVQHKQPAGGQMIQATGSNTLVANNTLLTFRGTGPMPAAGSISHLIDPGHAGEFFQGTIRDNYIDPRGVQYGVFYPSAQGSNVEVSGNIDMVTGNIIQASNIRRRRVPN